MYLHIGKDIVLNTNCIIGIFNLEYIDQTKEYKNLYKKLEEEKRIINISEGMPKTIILTNTNNETKGYISNIGSNTIGKRNN